MAATRLIALHKNKGKSVAACLKSRTDYAKNPDKTNKGELVSSYECSPLTADEEFMLSKRQYELTTGRRQKNDVIAYQIRQSFRPGEITAEEANKVGYELAMRFTKGKYAFIVATHTDREHIHNHIIYNSTALDGTRKFRDFFFSALAVQRLSDLICLEHQLSVIEIKPYRERQKRTLYPPKESNRDRLCSVIDSVLDENPKDYEDFLQKLEQQGYEVKRGKYTSVKGAQQKRFIRFRTLGAGYSEEELKVVLAGEAEHRPRQKSLAPEQKFQMLVDIQAKLAEGKGTGFAHWAKQHNLKEMSRTLVFLQENKIGSIEDMAVTPWGDLYPCHQFVGDPKYLMGDIWKGVTNTAVRDEFKHCNAYARKECQDCWAKLYCSGGCAANSYHATGSITGVYEYGCELFRKRMECAIMIQVAQNQELAAQGIEVPIQLGSTCNACADGEACE